ncbi:hypothetical protein E0Z10_g5151 [Xylaria hypoxylon]|uniref:Transmembrane protein n=1 Tax=Xylaria hypoxylon TaxID=37992 RepID=A0A4Z0YWR6_9PEZI|nr:hypothetical protein E0Z10_g5151 [Xylaria hypoxylon]
MMEYQTPTPSFQPATFPVDNGQPPSLPPPPPPPPQQQQQQFEQPPIVAEPFVGTDLKTMKTATETSLREYAALQKQGGGAGRERLRAQGGLAASDLRALRSEVALVMKTAQAGRWRKWLLGGIVAAIIPAVRKIFRRSSDDKVSSNDTEHAFRKSKSLIARILDHVHGKSGFASIAFFVLAVLYVFQSEVSVRVARTVSKRLKILVAKVEDGVEEVGEQDLKLLNGWRWRVLLW